MTSKLSAGLALALALLATPARSSLAAPALEVEAALSQATAEVGDVVSLEVRVTARVDGGLELALPALDGFTELSRSKSEGTSISWNGRSQSITREHVVVLELQVGRAGRLEVPAITARVGDTEARSRPLALVVGASPEQIDRVPGRVPPPGPDEARLFVRYRVSQGEAWLGQEVLLDLEIFADPSAAFGVEEVPPPPELDGFWREVLEQPQRLEPRAEVVEGRRYQVYRLWRMALYGLEAGERVVPATAIGFSEGRSLLGAGRRLRRKAPPLTLLVKPLPSEGRPRDFAATSVGRFTLAATLDADRVPADKAVLLTITVEGTGNLKNLRLPAVTELDGFRVFPPTVKDELTPSLQGLAGRKRAELLLMPTRGGRLEVPALEWSYFDPERGTYERLRTQAMPVVVEGEPAPEAVAAAPAPPAAPPETPREALRPLRFRSSLEPPGRLPWRDPAVLGAWALPPLALLALLALEAAARRRGRETPASRRRAAVEQARAQLALARDAAERGDAGALHAAIAEGLLGLASARCEIPLRGMTGEQVQAALAARGAPEVLARGLAEALEAADYARFAPSLAAVDARASLERGARVLALLEAFEPGEVRS